MWKQIFQNSFVENINDVWMIIERYWSIIGSKCHNFFYICLLYKILLAHINLILFYHCTKKYLDRTMTRWRKKRGNEMWTIIGPPTLYVCLIIQLSWPILLTFNSIWGRISCKYVAYILQSGTIDLVYHFT